MKLSFEYKGIKVNYYLIYKKTSAISIQVDSQKRVHVTAPVGTSVQTVMDKVKGNAPWIISEINKDNDKKEVDVLADHYTYLGKKYGVEILVNEEREKVSVKLSRGKFVIQTPKDNKSEIKKALIEWYKDKVTGKLKERMDVYGQFFHKIPSEIIVEEDQTVLFQAHEDRIFANLALGMIPVGVIDYIIVSALCRLSYSDSSEEKLKSILPNYQEYKEWLEKNKGCLIM